MNRNVVKGLLIILVVFDHNEYAHLLFEEFLRGFSFHVVGFFALPFLREENNFKVKSLDGVFFSYYYPFLWMVLAMSAINCFLSMNFSGGRLFDIAVALYSGSALSLKQATSMALLWFLPAFVSLIFIRDRVLLWGRWGKAVSVLFFLIVHLFVGTIDRSRIDLFPLGMLSVMYIIPVVIFIVEIHHSFLMRLQRVIGLVLSLSVFLIVKVIQIKNGFSQEVGFVIVSDYKDLFSLLVNDLEAVTGTLLIFQMARFNIGTMLEWIGKFSLQVYLVHAFIALIMFKVLQLWCSSWWIGLRFGISLLLTAVLSAYVGEFLMRSPIAKRFLFPRCWSELIGSREHPEVVR